MPYERPSELILDPQAQDIVADIAGIATEVGLLIVHIFIIGGERNMLIVFPGQSVSPGLVTNISFCEILVEVGGGYAPVWIIKIVIDNCFYRAIAQLLNEYRISSLKLQVVNCFFGP